MASSKVTTDLNYDCLEHLFQFLTPKEWPNFAQVNQKWNRAAISKDLQEFKYVVNHNERDIERLEFSKFLKILEFVAPNLKYVKIKRMVGG